MPSSDTWWNTVGSGSDSRIHLEYDYINNDSTYGWIHNPRVVWQMKSGWSDSNNYIDVDGSLVNYGRVHPSGSSSQPLNSARTMYCTPSNVALSYGSTTNADFTVTVSGVSYFRGDGNTTTFTWNITLPARPYQLPDPATAVTSVYQATNLAYLSWTPHYTAANAAKPWSNQYIDRSSTSDWSSYTRVASLGGTATNWTDTSLVDNERYTFRHVAMNSAGYSTYAYAAAPVYTTPATVTAIAATKQTDNSILVSSTNLAPWADAFEFSDSPDGANWTVVAATNSTSNWTHAAPNQSITHRYRVRVRTPDGKWSGYSAVSNVVQLQAPPNPPTWVAGDSAYDATATITDSWVHNPVDTTNQTAYEIQRRASADNGATWTGWTSTTKITSSTSSRVWEANTFPQNRLIERQVRTWGAHATASGWSASATFRTSARPTVGITTPVLNAVVNGKTLTAAWTYADTEGSAQSSWRVFLYTSLGVELGSWAGANAATSFAIPYDLQNTTTYRVGVQVRDGVGLWSTLVTTTFSVTYLPPPTPVVTVEWDSARAAGVLVISNPAPIGGEPVAVSNNIYRDGVLIARGVTPSATYVDPLPSTSGSTYIVEAVSALPSMAAAAGRALPFSLEVYRRFWLNAGPGWSNVASFYGNVKRNRTTSVNRETEAYSGRDWEVETIGEGKKEEFSFSADIVQAEDSPSDFHEVSFSRTSVCFREPSGRYFVSIGPIRESTSQNITAGISFNMRRVDYHD